MALNSQEVRLLKKVAEYYDQKTEKLTCLVDSTVIKLQAHDNNNNKAEDTILNKSEVNLSLTLYGKM